ncbi:MAG: molybdopterin-dependent oxidoreductase [Coriobacteriia bacterium]
MTTTTKSACCRFCGYLCALTATIEDGRVISVEPDPTRFPYDERIQKGCHRWRATVEILDHPQRVNYPMRRVGERGSGKWERVSWDEALDDIASRLTVLAEKHGPQTLATAIGGPHATYWPLHRFMNLWGSPNNIGIGQICWNPGIWLNTIAYGWPIESGFDPDTTSALMLWATNPAGSDNSAWWRSVMAFARAGGPLIVVDPVKTRAAKIAQLWLPIRPGTDPVLGLGLIHAVIAEDLVDHAFVDEWCHGYAELCEHVAPYTPEAVSAVTGVPAADIVQAARLFAAGPSTLVSGRAIDQLGVNTAPTHRAFSILRAITGNVDRPGSCVVGETPDFVSEVDFELSDAMPQSCKDAHLNREHIILQTPEGYARVRELTMKQGRRLPVRYLTSTQPDLVWTAMLEGKPYPIRAMIVMGGDPLITQANSVQIHDALASLDLLIALEYFTTPTAMLADYVLPAASGLERPLLQTNWGTANIAYGGPQAITPYYERRVDYDFWRDLGCRLGQEEYWPWETLADAFNATLAPTGLTWEQFCAEGLYYVPPTFQKHEEIDLETGEKRGFATKTGKIELYSELLDELGYEPLPTPKPLPELTAEYPLTLITGARKHPFFASSYHQVESLVRLHPDPLAEMAPATAARLGLSDGDSILVETDRGRARFVLRTTEMVEDVVSAEYGRWYPEEEACEPGLSGTWKSNVNTLTNCDIEGSDPLIGTWTYNGLPCRITPASAQEL